MNETYNAFSALFANARTPQEQAAIRQRYAEQVLQNERFGRTEPSRLTDDRTALLRTLLGNLGPSLSAGGAPTMQAGGPTMPAWGSGDGWEGGRFTGSMPRARGGYGGGFGDGVDDDPMRPQTQNFLAALLRR